MNYWQGKHIRLRGLELADADTLHAWNDDSEMARGLSFLRPPSSLTSVKNWVTERIKQGAENDEIYCVIENKAGECVGMINSHHCNQRVGVFQYGVAVRAEHRRHGYAFEAVRMLVRYFFEELRYQKVNVVVYSYNEASIQLHERLGFQPEGRLRRTLYTNGRFHDQLFYGMTREEFKERQAA
jgi:RimJ/RimL family protein N-acetyltransferase